MRTILAGIAATAALASLSTASADPAVIAEGDILIGNPAGAVVGGVSEISYTDDPERLVFTCSQDETFRGLDGIGFEVPEDGAFAPATLTTTGDLALIVHLYWYDEDCGLVTDYSMAEDQPNQSGAIPPDAAFGVIDLIAGAQAHVVLTYEPAA